MSVQKAPIVIPLPKFIDVGPYRYTVTTDELTRQRAQEASQSSLLGQTDHDRLIMILKSDQPNGLMRDTLLHETLHLVTGITGVAFESGLDKEELLVRRLSPILLEVLRRNPDLVTYLLADL